MIGSGITGALFLAALGRMATIRYKKDNDSATHTPGDPFVNVDGAWSVIRKIIRWKGLPAAVVISIVTALLLINVFPLPAPDSGIRELVIRNLADSGVSNPVTAVLLNFRAYDTLLEIGVVLLALLGLNALGGQGRFDHLSDPESVLKGFYQLTLPLLILFSAYMVWVGKDEPGGAFQAAALLAAGGIIGRMTGANPLPHGWQSTSLRVTVSAGFAVFLSLGMLCWVHSGVFLRFAPASAGWLILVIEIVATFSIASTLIVLFLGSSGYPIPFSKPKRLVTMAREAE
jgi:multisubunit Na+/H+ antiporter MnhB subunit